MIENFNEIILQDVPFWMRSPSPMSLTFFSLLSLYGAYQFKPESFRKWLSSFGQSAFVLGLVILPFDMVWCVFHGLKWQYLFPNDYSWIGSIIRDIAFFTFSYYECLPLFRRDSNPHIKRNILLSIFIIFVPYFLIRTLFLTPNPAWMDYTLAYRLGYTDKELQAFLSYTCGLPSRVMQLLIYIKLWK